MNKTNSNGPRTNPWDTPIITDETEDVRSLIAYSKRYLNKRYII